MRTRVVENSITHRSSSTFRRQRVEQNETSSISGVFLLRIDRDFGRVTTNNNQHPLVYTIQLLYAYRL